MVCDRSQIGGGFGGGGGGFGFGGGNGRNPLIIDENALRSVATTTGGQYYRAVDAGQLQSALKKLPSTITVAHKHVDVADTFAGIGGLLIALAVGLSLWWNRVRRVPGSVTPPRAAAPFTRPSSGRSSRA
jgi:Ca-activated chloride channel family protein